MTITEGVNSFTTEAELYTHLATRLNGGDFSYPVAVLEAGITLQPVAQILNDMRGATFEAIESALIDAGIDYGVDTLQESYNTLQAGQTPTQIKNAQALMLATQLIDQFDFIGQPTNPAQPLQWPRVGAIDRNSQAIPDNSIPASIKKATSELAFFLLKNDITDPQQYHHLYLLTSERVGDSQVSFAKRASRKLPDLVMDYLKPLLFEKSGFSSALIA